MKTASKLLALLLLTCLAAHGQGGGRAPGPGQARPKIGFVRLVQAVGPGTGKANMLIDGEDIFPKGYEFGQRTGGMGFKEGDHTIEIRKQGVEAGLTKVTIAPNETVTLVAFAERIPDKPGEEGKPPKWKVKLLRLKQQSPEKGYHMTLVSVSAREEVQVLTMTEGRKKPEVSSVHRLSTAGVEVGRVRGDVNLKIGDKTTGSISLDDPGNYVVIIFDDDKGGLSMVSFYDPKFIIAG